MTPHRIHAILLAITAVLLLPVPASAQETRGSLVPDARIDRPDGTTVAAEDVAVGDTLWSLGLDGKPVAAKVTALRRQHSDSYLSIKVGTLEVQATGSQRIAVPGGRYVRFDALKVGDKILVWGAKGTEEKAVTAIRVYPANLICYDLTVEGDLPFRVGPFLLGD